MNDLTFLVVDVEPPADGVSFIVMMLLKSGLFNFGSDRFGGRCLGGRGGFAAPAGFGRGGFDFDLDGVARGGRGLKLGGLGVFFSGGLTPYGIFRVL